MKRIILILFFLVYGISVQAQEPEKPKTPADPKQEKGEKKKTSEADPALLPQKRIAYYSSWTERGAKVVPFKELYLSAIAVSRFGNYYRETEINSQLLLMPFVPNIGIKHEWFGRSTIVSSQHTFYYPTPGLNWAKNNDFDNQIPATAKIPQIFTFRNEVIVSHILNEGRPCTAKIPDLILTGRLGFDFSLKSGEQDFPIIDTHFLYQRTASYYDNVVVFLGAELAGNLYRNFNFAVTADLYSIGFFKEIALESQGRIYWHFNHSFALSGGYNLYHLSGADVENTFCITPAIDFTIKIGHKKVLQRGLFRPR